MKNISYVNIWVAVIFGLIVNAIATPHHFYNDIRFLLIVVLPISIGLVVTLIKFLLDRRLKNKGKRKFK